MTIRKTFRTLCLLPPLIFWQACAQAGEPPVSDGEPPAPRAVMPGIASTADHSEIRLTISPDGARRLWGVVGHASKPDKLTIVESVRTSTGWSVPKPVSFASNANDFDPFFMPDGSAVLFFSDREGGQGKEDIWQAEFDPVQGLYGEPENLGPGINGAGREWAPAISPDGRILLFSSDSRSGFGGQDLYLARRDDAGTYRAPENLGGEVNGAGDDFDAAFVGAARIVFSSGDLEAASVFLYQAELSGETYGHKRKMPPPFNCSSEMNNGPYWSVREPDLIYYSATCPDYGPGRMDIFAAPAPWPVEEKAAVK